MEYQKNGGIGGINDQGSLHMRQNERAGHPILPFFYSLRFP
jgi:hypothetical protein